MKLEDSRSEFLVRGWVFGICSTHRTWYIDFAVRTEILGLPAVLRCVQLACCRIKNQSSQLFYFFPDGTWVKLTACIILQFFPSQSEDHIQTSSRIDAYFCILSFLLIPYSLFSHLTRIRTE